VEWTVNWVDVLVGSEAGEERLGGADDGSGGDTGRVDREQVVDPLAAGGQSEEGVGRAGGVVCERRPGSRATHRRHGSSSGGEEDLAHEVAAARVGSASASRPGSCASVFPVA
jgi:hypothetical protein